MKVLFTVFTTRAGKPEHVAFECLKVFPSYHAERLDAFIRRAAKLADMKLDDMMIGLLLKHGFILTDDSRFPMVNLDITGAGL